nr:MAG TPA: hypothetical protein [Caudoviricetes sp.]
MKKKVLQYTVSDINRKTLGTHARNIRVGHPLAFIAAHTALVDSIRANVKNCFGYDEEMADDVLHVLAAALLTGQGQKIIDDLDAMAGDEKEDEE